MLLDTCESFAKEFDVTFNSSKSVCIQFGKHRSTSHPEVMLSDAQLAWSRSVKHLGNIITTDLTDKADIKLKTNDLVRRINSLVANFRHLSREAVVKLFHSQCAFYGAQQWNLADKKALEILHVQWRKGIRRLWNLPWTARSSILPSLIHKSSLPDQLYGRFIKLYWSMLKSENSLVSLTLSVCSDGIVNRNIRTICEMWQCSVASLKKSWTIIRRQIAANELDCMRAEQIRDLNRCLEGSMNLEHFNLDEIRTLITFISTY